MPKSYMIFARKINKIPEFYMIYARKVYKMPEFYTILPEKNSFCPNLGGGGGATVPLTPHLLRLC